MAASVTVRPSGKVFEVFEDETVLDAALRQGVILPYGCKNGACGSCKAKVVAGSFAQDAFSPNALRGEEQARGLALMCRARPTSDLEVEARVIQAGEIQVKKLPCRVQTMRRLAPDVIELELQLPATEKFQFLAGQFVELILRDGTRRSYSLACAPHEAQTLRLHVRHMPGGKFTDLLFGHAQPALKERDILRLEGPMGTFFLREDSPKPMVLLASGTGFAPVRSIIEHARHKSIQRSMTLYWGGRRPHDLYENELCERWMSELPGFRYVPVVSDALPEDHWQGRSGFVHRAVMQDFPDLSGYQVYACGAPVVIEAARADFQRACGLPEDEFFADSFTTAADLAQS